MRIINYVIKLKKGRMLMEQKKIINKYKNKKNFRMTIINLH